MSLDINWRETATLYISEKDGSDSNDGLTKLTPKQTIGSLRASSVIIRSGYYNEGDFVAQSILRPSITGDDLVIIDGNGFFNFNYSSSNSGGGDAFYRNLVFLNFSGYIDNGLMLSFEDCVLKNCNSYPRPFSFTPAFNRCLVINGTHVLGQSGFRNTINASTFIGATLDDNGTVDSGHIIRTCVFDKNVVYDFPDIRIKTFKKCAFEDDGATTGFGFINALTGRLTNQTLDGDGADIGTTYGDGEKFSGLITTASGAIIFEDCFWTADLMFNDPASDDYTPKYSFTGVTEEISPLWNNGNVIGAYQPSLRIDASHPAFNPINTGVIIDPNIAVSGTSFVLTGGTEGTITSSSDPNTAIELPYSIAISEAIQFFGDFNYAAGEWIDKTNYVSGVTEEVRQTYEIDYVNEVTGNFIGQWKAIEVNSIPKIDNTGLGNGNVDVDFTRVGQVQAKRFRLRFTLRNNGI